MKETTIHLGRNSVRNIFRVRNSTTVSIRSGFNGLPGYNRLCNDYKDKVGIRSY